MVMVGFKSVNFLFNSVGMVFFDLCCGFVLCFLGLLFGSLFLLWLVLVLFVVVELVSLFAL